MFGRKRRELMNALDASNKELLEKNKKLESRNKILETDKGKLQSDLTAEKVSNRRLTDVAANLRGELDKAVGFIKKEGYKVTTSDNDGISHHFSGKSRLATELEIEIRELQFAVEKKAAEQPVPELKKKFHPNKK